MLRLRASSRPGACVGGVSRPHSPASVRRVRGLPDAVDVLWAPLFLGVLFLVHPLLGAIGAGSALFVVGLALAGEFFTKGPLAQSGAALTKSYGRICMAVGNVHVIRAIGMLDGAARLVCQAAQAARSAHETAQRRN
jgi:ABC-type protease/lipase transport system fused ATPase/permease subunit